MSTTLTRRDFMSSVSSAAALGAVAPFARPLGAAAAASASKVAIVRTGDRKKGVADVMRLLNVQVPKGKDVVIKPNFNTADPAPGSTDIDTLKQLMAELLARDARGLTIGESSGPPQTRKVMEDKGVFDLASEMKARVVNFEDLADADWVAFKPAGSYWPGGFAIPRLVTEAPFVVSTCCLKTHGFGGVYSMSMKLAVGLTPKSIRRDMHGDRDHMRHRIAELNLAYAPGLIVMDGVEVFTDGGPSQGTRGVANVFVGGTDRVAVDAVGLAILKEMGSNAAIMEKKIFEQDQVVRAIELKLGVSSPSQIELVTGDAASREFAEKIKARLVLG
jgi:uncharacterized protein (DUF362 family)